MLDVQPSKEEEERRKIRRERNKIAAAKCRNRRRELIDTLQAVSVPLLCNAGRAISMCVP